QRQQETLGVYSPTSSMEDTLAAFDAQVSDARSRLPYVEGSRGLAVAIAGRIVSIDLLDKPSTCQKVWDWFLSGVVIEGLMAGKAASSPEIADVERTLSQLRLPCWHATRTVGEGQEYRAVSDGLAASMLRFNDSLVHFSVAALR